MLQFGTFGSEGNGGGYGIGNGYGYGGFGPAYGYGSIPGSTYPGSGKEKQE